MNDSSRQWTQDERQALAALSTLIPAVPGAEARARARRAFLSVPRTRTSRRPARIYLWPAVAVAAVLAGLVIFGYQPVLDYRITEVVGPEGVQARAEALVPGSVLNPGLIRTEPGSEMEILLGHNLRLRVLGGSELQLPRPPGRWFGRRMQLDVTAGEVYGTSGGQHPDFTVILATAEAKARLLGTTFAAFRTDAHTCFCLFSGGMLVQFPDSEAEESLAVGNRIFIYRDGRPFSTQPLSGMETMKLQMMDEAGVE